MAVIDKEVGERIKSIRELRGYTREILSEKSGISTKFLYEIEKGRKGFSAMNLYNISEALQVSCDYIMTGMGNTECDKELIEVIQLFDHKQAKRVSLLLKQIYELL